MKKFIGGVMIVIGIILTIPVGLRVMHLMGYLVGFLFDPMNDLPPYSITSIATTIVLISGMIVFFKYGSKFWKGVQSASNEDETNDNPL